PRSIKRKMFTCTECAQCISACNQVQAQQSRPGLLKWVEQLEAIPVVTGRDSNARRSTQPTPQSNQAGSQDCSQPSEEV
ncbi:MAG: hypothetical protein OQK80_05080, partial [Sedimenticola sp.]|nr:hypothetical protein [Sedimenticola sp.]